MIFKSLARKGALLGALSSILLTACRDPSAWAYQAEPRRGMKSAELRCEPERQLSGMRLQMLKTDDGIHNMLSIFVGKFTTDSESNTTIQFRSEEQKESYKAHCMEGGQRCLLPEIAALRIKEQLSNGHSVILHTKRQVLTLKPADFNKLYKKLEKR